jgi:hypothetical protein
MAISINATKDSQKEGSLNLEIKQILDAQRGVINGKIGELYALDLLPVLQDPD